MRLSCLLLCVLPALGQSAPPHFEPPTDTLYTPFSFEQGKALASAPGKEIVFSDYAGMNEMLKASYEAYDPEMDCEDCGKKRFAHSVDIELTEPLFENPVKTEDGYQYVTRVRSVGALTLGLTVKADIDAPEFELYVIAPRVGRSFGPFYKEDMLGSEGRCLPLLQGEEIILVLLTNARNFTELRLLRYSHGFEQLFAVSKLESCHIDLACAEDGALRILGSGTGLLIFANSVYCSSALVNVPATQTNEPYLLTAAHCVSTDSGVTAAEIIWDFQLGYCGSVDAPDLDLLPRSFGDKLLETSAIYDMTLMSLDSVESGPNGRAYLGWNATPRTIGDDLVTIGHPDQAPTKISFGSVKKLNLDVFGGTYIKAVLAKDGGVTEGGSSGSPVVLHSADYSLIGIHSGALQHTCGRENNIQFVGALSDFFPQVSTYLNKTDDPGNGGGGSTGCATKTALRGQDPELLARAYEFRDWLNQSSAGRLFVDLYYKVLSPVAKPIVEESEIARKAYVHSLSSVLSVK
ncbi:MAG: trypsin-like peptidase domain-containing protein [Candidatus Hydrogenedentes bacterium]|nr:trypsin-like peptidase domain-containing protein [Candidatus Hydrogenedentota bacterium]